MLRCIDICPLPCQQNITTEEVPTIINPFTEEITPPEVTRKRVTLLPDGSSINISVLIPKHLLKSTTIDPNLTACADLETRYQETLNYPKDKIGGGTTYCKQLPEGSNTIWSSSGKK